LGHSEHGTGVYNGGLGWEPQQGPGAKPLVSVREAESFLTVERRQEAAHLPPLDLLYFAKSVNQRSPLADLHPFLTFLMLKYS